MQEKEHTTFNVQDTLFNIPVLLRSKLLGE
jgi:hypothetical protein